MEIRDDRQMRALTGVSKAQFEILLAEFSQTYQADQQQQYEAGLADGSRQRAPGGGRKGALPSLRDKLLFVLYYFKVYPTFDVLGSTFKMSRSKANENLHKLTPILQQTLVNLGLMPHRAFTSLEEFQEAIVGLECLLIDVTERNYRRPQDQLSQQEHYSGKKKDTGSKIPSSAP